jgi:hypothetical protein
VLAGGDGIDTLELSFDGVFGDWIDAFDGETRVLESFEVIKIENLTDETLEFNPLQVLHLVVGEKRTLRIEGDNDDTVVLKKMPVLAGAARDGEWLLESRTIGFGSIFEATETYAFYDGGSIPLASVTIDVDVNLLLL